MAIEYAMYRGDEFIDIGTIDIERVNSYGDCRQA